MFLTRQGSEGWQRVLLQEVRLEGGLWNFDLIWNPDTRSIGVDVYKRHREAAPATMTWENGRQSMHPGYVIEKAVITQVFRHNREGFEYFRLSEPELWPMSATGEEVVLSKESAPSHSDWKTYRNPTYGFEIQYPPFLEPLEGQAMFFFRQASNAPVWLKVCFGSD